MQYKGFESFHLSVVSLPALERFLDMPHIIEGVFRTSDSGQMMFCLPITAKGICFVSSRLCNVQGEILRYLHTLSPINLRSPITEGQYAQSARSKARPTSPIFCKISPYFLNLAIHKPTSSRTFKVLKFAAFEVFYYLSLSYLRVWIQTQNTEDRTVAFPLPRPIIKNVTARFIELLHKFKGNLMQNSQ